MSDEAVLSRISELVEEEHRLRGRGAGVPERDVERRGRRPLEDGHARADAGDLDRLRQRRDAEGARLRHDDVGDVDEDVHLLRPQRRGKEEEREEEEATHDTHVYATRGRAE